MPIDRDRRVVFVHIPKTGGTTIETILELYEPWPAVRMDILRGPYERDGEELHLQHLPLEELSAVAGVDFSNWYKFGFVRNPWDRLVSSFCFKSKNKRVKNATQMPMLSQDMLIGLTQLCQLGEVWSVQTAISVPKWSSRWTSLI